MGRKARLKSLENDAIQAQLVIQKMSELSTQESSDDLDPISESPSKTLDEDKHESSSENDETLDDDDDENLNPDFQANDNTLDTANANLQITTDNQNNIPVECSEESLSHELTHPPEDIREEIVETEVADN